MMKIITAPVGAKAQITLPKAIREALHLKPQDDLVGFIIHGKRIAITRIEPVPSNDPFSEEEWEQIERLAARPPVATLHSASASLRFLKQRLHAPVHRSRNGTGKRG